MGIKVKYLKGIYIIFELRFDCLYRKVRRIFKYLILISISSL